jgi:hypothetical protein
MGTTQNGKRRQMPKKPWPAILLLIAVILLGGFILTKVLQSGVTDPGLQSGTGAQGTQGIPAQTMPQQAEADYEKWLSAAMVVGLSMEYPDFVLTGIYTASETALENKKSSEGVYIFFTSGGKTQGLYGVALERERTESGTRDISTNTVGFATFDLVEPESVDVSAMKQIFLEEIGELIAQSVLVSIYTH